MVSNFSRSYQTNNKVTELKCLPKISMSTSWSSWGLSSSGTSWSVSVQRPWPFQKYRALNHQITHILSVFVVFLTHTWHTQSLLPAGNLQYNKVTCACRQGLVELHDTGAFVQQAQAHIENFRGVHAHACKHTHILYAHTLRQIDSFFEVGFELKGYTLPLVSALVDLFRTGSRGCIKGCFPFSLPLCFSD